MLRTLFFLQQMAYTQRINPRLRNSKNDLVTPCIYSSRLTQLEQQTNLNSKMAGGESESACTLSSSIVTQNHWICIISFFRATHVVFFSGTLLVKLDLVIIRNLRRNFIWIRQQVKIFPIDPHRKNPSTFDVKIHTRMTLPKVNDFYNGDLWGNSSNVKFTVVKSDWNLA